MTLQPTCSTDGAAAIPVIKTARSPPSGTGPSCHGCWEHQRRTGSPRTNCSYLTCCITSTSTNTSTTTTTASRGRSTTSNSKSCSDYRYLLNGCSSRSHLCLSRTVCSNSSCVYTSIHVKRACLFKGGSGGARGRALWGSAYLEVRHHPIMTSLAPVSETEGAVLQFFVLIPQTTTKTEWLLQKGVGRITTKNGP